MSSQPPGSALPCTAAIGGFDTLELVQDALAVTQIAAIIGRLSA